MANAYDIPDGFEPVAAANENQQQPVAPEGFEPVPAQPQINPAPQAYQQRVMQGEELEKFLAKSYPQRLAEWSANKINEGSYGQAAVGVGSTVAAGLLEFPFDFTKQVMDFVKDKVYGAGPKVDDELPDNTLSREVGIGFNAAMLTMGSAAEFTRPVGPLIVGKDGIASRVVVDAQGNKRLNPVGEFPPKAQDFDAAATNIATSRGGFKLQPSKEDVGGPFNVFDITDAGGKKMGEAHVSFTDFDHTKPGSPPRKATIEDIFTNDFIPTPVDEAGMRAAQAAAQNTFGSSAMRGLLRQFREMFPDVTEIGGRRVSGARGDVEDVETGGIDVRVPLVRNKLMEMWENEGKHPAEVAEDAKNDAFLAHDLSSAAAVPTDIPPLVSPDVQPITIPGKIVADLKGLVQRTFDVGRWVQEQLAPISTMPDPTIRLTTEYLSNLRRGSWDWNRYDKKITDTLDLEQRQAVWRAMDEESVMAQSGERSEHMGLATLSPEERAIAEELTQHAITTRMQMVDRGMVQTEGLPHYVPRLFEGIEKDQRIDLGPDFRLSEKTGTMKERKYLTAEESEAAARAKFGPQTNLVRDIRTLPLALAKQQKAIAAHDLLAGLRDLGRDIGDPIILDGDIPVGEAGKWETIPEDKLTEWGLDTPNKAPQHIKKELANVIKVLSDAKFNNWDRFVQETKNRPISLIMNSPFIHDSVVFSKALPSNPGNLLTFRFMREGPQLLRDVKFMHDMIEGGLVLWGKRAGFKQDITGIMEDPTLTAGRSLTANALAYIPGLFSEKGSLAVKTAVDKAGELVHDKLLGEQVQKLQVSLAYDYRETLRKKFPLIPDDVLNVLAAHEGNRFGGSLPVEAMSAFSRGLANSLLFSRQFTLGNIGILKDMVKGPPEYVMGRIRDMLPEGPEGADQAAMLKGASRRHSFGVVALDFAMYAGAYAIFQTALDLAKGTPQTDETAGYWDRLEKASKRLTENPFSPSSYLTFFPSLSPTFYHEPGKEGRVLMGYRDDGTAIYARTVLGRMGEDYLNLAVHPSSYLLTKMAPLPKSLLEVIGNKDSFDKPIYDPKALREGDVWQAWNLAKHMIEAELPMEQIKGAAALASGKGDYKDAINTFGPYLPPPLTLTGSQGYPGGPEAGMVAAKTREQKVALDVALAGIKDMVVNKNDIGGAQQRLAQLGVKPSLQNWFIRNWQSPGKVSTRTLMNAWDQMSPVEKDVFESVRTR